MVGADDKFVYVNDPLWKDNRRTQGFRKAWTHAEFYAAWSSCHLDGNRDCSGILTKAALPVSAYGSGAGPASRQFALDPQTANRIRAWAYFNNAPQPVLENPATANAYLTVMGGWGTRVVRHAVVENDDLSMLAFHYYGDGLKWRVILAFNGLEGADAIADGDLLLIPQPLESPLHIPPNRRPVGGVGGFQFQVDKQQVTVSR